MEREHLPAVFAWTVCLGATTAVALATSRWWWRVGAKRGAGGGKGARKPLVHSPGIEVVCVQDASAGSNGLLSGWGASMIGGASSGKDGASKWEKSKQKGDLGYYFAHHITMKELAPEDYRMNGPRLLSKGDAPAGEAERSGNPGSAAPPPAAPRRRAQQISSYSWEDYGEEVRLSFRQSGWEWGKVEEEEIRVEWAPRRFRLSIDSREYGLHTVDIPRLNGDVAGVRVRKLKSRLAVALVKGGRGSYSKKAPWMKLQAAPEKPSEL